MADCVEKHTLAPPNYVDWHRWAECKSRTHYQQRCLGCGLWAVWKPKKDRP